MSWNSLYTHRKQKEMTKKAISDSKSKKNKPVHRGFGYDYQQTESYQSKRAEELRRDKFAWRVGYFAMAVITIVGSYAIYWAATGSH